MATSVDLKNYSVGNYYPGNKLKIVLWMVFSRLFIATSLPYPMFFKKFILELFGAKIAKGVVLKQNILIKYPWFLEIGEHTWIGENVWIDNLTNVFIGSNCCVSQGAMLLTGNHNFKKTSFDLIVQPIILEDSSWVGAKVIVCPGVTVGRCSVITVGSVATKATEPYGIYTGNPAAKLKYRTID